MNISSSLKKIISFMLVAVLAVSAVVLPVSAAEVTTEEEEKPQVMFDLTNAYYDDPADLKYTGVKSENLTEKFNVRQEYDMSFTNLDYYFCQPFSLTTYDGRDPVSMFTGDKAKYGDMFSLSYLESVTADFFKENSLSLSNYEIYYYGVVGRFGNAGHFNMFYYLVPKNRRIAFCNGHGPTFNNGEGVFGVYARSSSFACLNNNDTSNSIVCVHRDIDAYSDTMTDTVKFAKTYTPPNAFVKDEAYYYKMIDDSFSFGGYQAQPVCSNLPVFNTVEDAGLYVNEIRDPIPDNKAPAEEPEEKVGADAFYWDSLKCRISQQGQAYNFVYDYSYSVPDMVAHPEEYVVYTDYSQVINFKMDKALTYQQSKFDAHSSFSLASSNKSVVDTVTINKVDKQVNNLNKFLLALDVLSAQKFLDTDFANAELLSAHIYVTVTLVHTIDGGNGLSVKDKVSSDVRTFKFDATTLESLDSPEEIKSDVKIDDTKDENGKVIDRTVSQVVTNDNSTHQTINNYYYDSDGNRKESSGSSIGDSLSDIASGLIKFIKTLVTEGLPAALEILKSLIKTISDLLGFIGDQIGDIGQGTQNGIIAVLKAIPVPLWGICSVGIIAYVIVGVVKKFF